MNKLAKLIFILILFTVCNGSLILATNFDCNKSKTLREQTICNDPKLYKLDSQIGEIYQKLNQKGKYYKEIFKNQKKWISKSNNFEIYDFERQRDFLNFSSLFSNCLQEKEFNECYNTITEIDLEKCMGNLTTYEMSRCMISFTEALDILEQVESQKLVEYLQIEDPESVSFFVKARDSWLDYRNAECLLFYNFYRNGSIRSIMYTSCVDKKTHTRLKWILEGRLLN